MPVLEGKVAVITGAASGIGRAGALRFAAEGARVVLADVQAEGLERLAEEIGAERALAVRTDVTDESAVAETAERAVQRFGRIDVGLFCAGRGGFGRCTCWSATPSTR